jgi:hypothetical protein
MKEEKWIEVEEKKENGEESDLGMREPVLIQRAGPRLPGNATQQLDCGVQARPCVRELAVFASY